jgi:small subunit ribosomal protein S7
MTRILSNLRTTPPPSIDPKRPLLLLNTPASALPLNPVLYLTLAIDSVAPLMRIRSQRGAAGGGLALQIPVALGMKQRRRTAIKWILDAVKNKPSGGGNEALAKKIADEIISIVEGRSGVWTKRDLVHRTGITARANVKWAMTRKR